MQVVRCSFDAQLNCALGNSKPQTSFWARGRPSNQGYGHHSLGEVEFDMKVVASVSLTPLTEQVKQNQGREIIRGDGVSNSQNKR